MPVMLTFGGTLLLPSDISCSGVAASSNVEVACWHKLLNPGTSLLACAVMLPWLLSCIAVMLRWLAVRTLGHQRCLSAPRQQAVLHLHTLLCCLCKLWVLLS